MTRSAPHSMKPGCSDNSPKKPPMLTDCLFRIQRKRPGGCWESYAFISIVRCEVYAHVIVIFVCSDSSLLSMFKIATEAVQVGFRVSPLDVKNK